MLPLSPQRLSLAVRRAWSLGTTVMGNVMKGQDTENGAGTNGVDPMLKATDYDTLVVLVDYPSRDISQPIFRIGERLRVLSEEGCWWKVRSLRTETENYIPNNYVAKVYHGWLFEGVVRQKAEELLRLPGNIVGSFMIRERPKEKGVYCLSVRHRCIMHYKIFRLANSWYYISPRLTFQCLENLVNHYSDSAEGLCCILTAPCLTLSTDAPIATLQAPPVVMRQNFDWKKVDKSQLLNGQGCLDNRDAMVSYGVRNSIASYLSLTGAQDDARQRNRKKKSKSVYVLPDHSLSNMDIEDDHYV